MFQWVHIEKLEELSDNLKMKMGWVVFENAFSPDNYLTVLRFDGAQWTDYQDEIHYLQRATRFMVIGYPPAYPEG